MLTVENIKEFRIENVAHNYVTKKEVPLIF